MNDSEVGLKAACESITDNGKVIDFNHHSLKNTMSESQTLRLCLFINMKICHCCELGSRQQSHVRNFRESSDKNQRTLSVYLLSPLKTMVITLVVRECEPTPEHPCFILADRAKMISLFLKSPYIRQQSVAEY